MEQQQQQNTIQIKKMLTNYKLLTAEKCDLSLFKRNQTNETNESDYNTNIKKIYINLTYLNRQYKFYKKDLEDIETIRKLLKIRIAQYKDNSYDDYINALITLDKKNKKYDNICESMKEIKECNQSFINCLKKLEDEEYLRDAKEIEDAEKQETNIIQDKTKNWWRGLFRCI